MRYRFGPFELEARNFELRRDGVRVPIQPKAFDLLVCLLAKRNEVVTKTDLMETVWPGVSVTKDSLAQAMMAVRTALGDDVEDARYIHTVRGRGYRFVAEVETDSTPPREPQQRTSSPDLREQATLIGREKALAVADDKLAVVSGGRGALVLLVGEAGVGKTFFLEAITARAPKFTSIGVTCASDAGAPDLWPFVQAARELRRLGATLDVEPASLADGKLSISSLDDPKARFRLAEQLAKDFAAVARRAPIVFWLDDTHLADAHTLSLLLVLAPLVRTAPIFTVVSYRPRSARHKSFEATLGALSREPQSCLVELEPFGREQLAAFVEQRVGHRPEAAVLDKLLEKTKGNPLFLSQMVHVLRTENRLKVSVPTTALVGGEGMREAIMHHLTALPDSAVHILTMAAVFGRTFGVAALAAALATTNEALLQELDVAEAARVVARDGSTGYRFNYPLIRDVLYKKLSASDRAQMHRKAALALEHRLDASSTHESVGEVARHLVEAAAAGDVELALDWSLRAARLASEAGARDAAAAYAQRGLDALAFAHRPDEARRAQLLAFKSGALPA